MLYIASKCIVYFIKEPYHVQIYTLQNLKIVYSTELVSQGDGLKVFRKHFEFNFG